MRERRRGWPLPSGTHMPTRVLYLHHLPLRGGAAASLLALIRHLPPEAVEAHLARPPGGPLGTPDLAQAAALHELPTWDPRWSPSPLHLLGELARLRAMSTRIRALSTRTRPDLIHANSWQAALAASCACGRRFPIIWHVRDLQVRPLITCRLRRAGVTCLAVSEAVRARLLDWGFPPGDIHLVPNSLDPTDFLPRRPAAAVRAELGIAPEAPLVINIGQYTPWKRQDLFLEAAGLVLGELPACRFVLVGEEVAGEEAYLGRLCSLATGPDLAEAAELFGYRDDVADLMGACDLYAHAATEEPFGRVILEAMALAKPVVAPAAAGPGEIVGDGETGLLVEPDSAAALAEGVLRLLRAPQLAADLGRRGRERLVECYTPQATVEATLVVYRHLLGDAP